MKRSHALLAAALLLLAPAGEALAKATPPRPVHTVSPTHPQELLAQAAEGRAVVVATVDSFGSVIRVEVESATEKAFGEAARAAAAQWVFEPGKRDGEPVEMRVKLPFEFKVAFERRLNAELGREVFRELDESVVSATEFAEKPKPASAPPFFRFYPEALKGSGRAASASVEFVVTPEGRVINPRVLSITDEAFEEAALRAAASLVYEPILIDGEPAYVLMTTPVTLREESRGSEPRPLQDGARP